MKALSLEVVTPLGVALQEHGVERVVVRRREPVADPGSEIVFLPGHGPALVRISPCVLRYRLTDGSGRRVLVSEGFAEVLKDRVTVLTSWTRPAV